MSDNEMNCNTRTVARIEWNENSAWAQKLSVPRSSGSDPEPSLSSLCDGF